MRVEAGGGDEAEEQLVSRHGVILSSASAGFGTSSPSISSGVAVTVVFVVPDSAKCVML